MRAITTLRRQSNALPSPPSIPFFEPLCDSPAPSTLISCHLTLSWTLSFPPSCLLLSFFSGFLGFYVLYFRLRIKGLYLHAILCENTASKLESCNLGFMVEDLGFKLTCYLNEEQPLRLNLSNEGIWFRIQGSGLHAIWCEEEPVRLDISVGVDQ